MNKFGGIDQASPNDALRSVQSAAGRILRVKTAGEALWLIENRYPVSLCPVFIILIIVFYIKLMCSERTFGDLIHTSEYPVEWDMKMVIRQWRDGIDVGNEFRYLFALPPPPTHGFPLANPITRYGMTSRERQYLNMLLPEDREWLSFTPIRYQFPALNPFQVVFPSGFSFLRIIYALIY